MRLAKCAGTTFVVVVAIWALGASAASAAPPRWELGEAGSWVSLNEEVGLAELMSQQQLTGQGELRLGSYRSPPGEPPISNCLLKASQSIENPANPALPGTAEMEGLESICEKGTGNTNAGEPSPCAFGEPIELNGRGMPWPGTLEASPKGKGYGYFEHLSGVDIEVFCLRNRRHAFFTGSLTLTVNIGRLGGGFGDLEDHTTGERIYFLPGTTDYIEAEGYKDVRAHVKNN